LFFNNSILRNKEPIHVIPQHIKLDPAVVSLGETLFHDPRLSHDQKMACASCHQLAQGGDDGLPTSITNSGQPDVINAPTVFNSGFNYRQTWRGAFRSLEAQAEADLHNPRHANTTWQELLPRLRANKTYQRQFKKVYPKQGINRETVLDALANYQRSLITPNAPFDQYLRGDVNAINAAAKHGYGLFKNYGCISCHHGINVGGTLFQKIGVFKDYFQGREISKADLGRFNVTQKEQDKYVFRVPSLRNIAVTGPYFHDGQVESLEKAVLFMASGQLGINMPDEDMADIVEFLHSLTGDYQGVRLQDQ